MQAVDVLKWLQANENYMLVDGRWFTSDGVESVELTAEDIAGAYTFSLSIEERELCYLSDLLAEMCKAWKRSVGWLKEPYRSDNRPIMKRIFWMAARKIFPRVSIKAIAFMVGVTDHTTVIKGLVNANNWHSAEDGLFMRYYNKVAHLIEVPELNDICKKEAVL